MHADVLSVVSPAVILVEEAAEILEPQILAVLHHKVQHLIQIGDHKQLRPQVSVTGAVVHLGKSRLYRAPETNHRSLLVECASFKSSLS
jgi:superfamily I DNA and/or RNA helicase